MIERDTHAAAARDYDLIVVGGGVYGARLLLEASRRGLRALLIEEHDFASSGSWNAPRLIQGGLSGIMQCNMPMAVAALREQRWLCRMFPHVVRPLPCLRPLYAMSANRRVLLQAAHRLNDVLAGVQSGRRRFRHGPPNSRTLNLMQAVALCPDIELRNLNGGLLWYEAAASSVQRLVIELIHAACDQGATALNYCRMSQIVTRNGRVCGVRAHDRIGGNCLEMRSQSVALCRGTQRLYDPVVTQKADRRVASAATTLAMMVLLDRPPLSEATLVVDAPDSTGCRYTLQPCHNLILAGTKFITHHGADNPKRPSHQDVGAFLEELNDAVPNLGVSHEDVLRVYWHQVPMCERSRARAWWAQVHADRSLCQGVVEVNGTAMNACGWAARRTLRLLFGRTLPPAMRNQETSRRHNAIDLYEPEDFYEGHPGRISEAVLEIIRTESVQCVDDLLLRRTDWLADPRRTRPVKERLSQVIDTASVFSEGLPHRRSHAEPRSTTRQDLETRP